MERKMISVRGFTCRPVEKRAELYRPPATQSPATRPLAPRPAPVAKSPSPVGDSPPTKYQGELRAFSKALQCFHGCLVGRSSSSERFIQALTMMDLLRGMSAFPLPGLAELWEQARAMHRAAFLEIAGPEAEQVAAILAPAFVSPFVSPASSLPAAPVSPAPVPALQPLASPASASPPPASPPPASLQHFRLQRLPHFRLQCLPHFRLQRLQYFSPQRFSLQRLQLERLPLLRLQLQ